MARPRKNAGQKPESLLSPVEIPVEEQPYALPEGWKWVKLGDVASTISKGTTPKGGKEAYLPSGVSFLRVENIHEDGTISHENIAHVSHEQHLTFLKRSILEAGDVLISIAGTLGRTGIVRKVDLPMNTNQAVSFVRLNKGIENRYIRYFINSPISKQFIFNQTKVTSIPNLTLEIINSYPIPLPPLDVQKRIVSSIESLFAKLDAAKEKAETVIESFETRKAAILHKAFTGELTAKWREEKGISLESWEEKKLKECGDWCGGGTPDMNIESYWKDGNILWVTSKDMKYDLINDSIMKISMDGVNNSSAKLIRKPSLLFVTRSGILRRTLPISMIKTKFTTNQDLKILQVGNGIQLKYIFYICKSRESHILKTCMKNGTTVESINFPSLLQYKIPIAHDAEQTEITHILNDLLEKEQKIKDAAENVLEQIDLMKKAILARAFRGELG